MMEMQEATEWTNETLPEQENIATDTASEDEAVSNAADGQAQTDAVEDETEQLRMRVAELEQELKERDVLSDRVRQECAEFEQYFPEVSLHRVPDAVWEQVHAGVPLSAAYALYEKKQQKKEEAYRTRNESSAARSAGMPEAAGREYFSPAQVRAMSQSEVRENYDRIFESMRHWH